MSGSLRIFFWFLIGLLLVVIILEAGTPKPVDWRETYSIKDKIPFGTKIFYDYLDQNTAELELVAESPFTFLHNTEKEGTYILIKRDLNLGETAEEEILNWVEKGNTVLLSAEYADLFDSDTLLTRYLIKYTTQNIINYPTYNLANPKFEVEKNYVFDQNSSYSYFSRIDTLKHSVLGWTKFAKTPKEDNQNQINFIKIPYGEGELLFHSSPKVFTNYFLIKEGYEAYIENLMAYIDLEKPVYLDVYFDRNFNPRQFHTSPLYVILNNSSLKWGYYLLILGAVLFILFEGKRKQQVIPVIPPTTNRSYEYVRSISGIYQSKKDHLSIAHKVIEQFLEYIRVELRTPFEKIDPQTMERLSILTEISQSEIRELFLMIRNIQDQKKITKQELKLLNEEINKFKSRT